ncbi:sugar kinase [Devosia lacusdianchii]|uniref:tagatose kinase n=1 Tax=Devosia lacusdianchii TaxID=2917991 RepID=UPI001F05748A|nr:sugar kinase [Devosia sp. JXJ CY 41]
MIKVVTIGEIVVEIMAVAPGNGFREAIALVGPYPSGAPAIFIDQMAKQGQPCAMISCVGNDDFGWLNIERLKQDGVDVSAIRVHEDAVTGSAFVRYRGDGQRDFVFNIKHSANGQIGLTSEARAVIASAGHLHVMGSSLVSAGIIEAVLFALGEVKARGGTVSFDPNIRKEMLEFTGLRAALHKVLAQTDLFMPSGAEVLLFSDAITEETAARDILARGVRAVVLKQGAAGARYVDGTKDLSVPAFSVEEIDPTGAGDAFGATFLAGWLAGLDAETNLRRANGAGALAVGRKGPMEGTSTRAELDAFLARQVQA